MIPTHSIQITIHTKKRHQQSTAIQLCEFITIHHYTDTIQSFQRMVSDTDVQDRCLTCRGEIHSRQKPVSSI